MTGSEQALSIQTSNPTHSCPVLLQFATFLSLIMFVEVAVAITGYVFKDKVRGGGVGETR